VQRLTGLRRGAAGAAGVAVRALPRPEPRTPPHLARSRSRRGPGLRKASNRCQMLSGQGELSIHCMTPVAAPWGRAPRPRRRLVVPVRLKHGAVASEAWAGGPRDTGAGGSTECPPPPPLAPPGTPARGTGTAACARPRPAPKRSAPRGPRGQALQAPEARRRGGRAVAPAVVGPRRPQVRGRDHEGEGLERWSGFSRGPLR